MERLLDLSLFALVVIGFLVVAATGRLDLFALAAVALALCVRGLFFARNVDRQLSVKATTRLTVAYAFLYFVDLFALSQSFISATVHLVLFVLVVKLFSVHRDRDRLYLSIISFLLLLAAAILTIDTFFLAAFILFSLIAIVAFIAMEMRRSMESSATIAAPPRGHRLPRIVVATATVLIVSILLLTPPLFFALPRVSYGRLSQFAQQNAFTSGFSDDVTLGQIGRIQQSDTVVMRVQFDRTPPANLKWHGTTLTHFDGRRWFNRPRESELLYMRGLADNSLQLTAPQVRRILDGITYQSVPLSDRLRSGRAMFLGYKVSQEPLGANLFFFPSRLQVIRGAARDYLLDGRASITYQDSGRMVRSYEGVSVLDFGDQNNPAPETPDVVWRAFVELPPMDPRVSALAESITRGLQTPYEKASAIENHLRTRFGYTLEMQASSDPIPFFLFERKKGHCEYFASAMAVMLRSQGIPSRIVNGFRNGEQSDITGSYIIRAKDAHSWVEAFIPGRGWVEFDPTPAAPPTEQTLWTRVGLYIDAAREFWGEWIINYDFGHQNILAELTTQKTRSTTVNLQKWFTDKYTTIIARLQSLTTKLGDPQRFESPKFWGVVAAALVTGALLLYWINRKLQARRMAKLPAPGFATAWFARLLRRTSRRGIAKSKAQTATQWAHSVDDRAVRDALAKFVAAYEDARFGDSPDSAAKLPELYEEVEEALKK